MLKAGETCAVSGYFTMFEYIENRAWLDLERRLGLPPFLLREGFAVAVLAFGERLAPQDFELQASSRFSDGLLGEHDLHIRKALPPRRIEEQLEDRGQSVHALKEKVCALFAKGGGKTPAKVLPSRSVLKGAIFPDANINGKREGVPQFRLKVPKRFVIKHVVGSV